MFTSPRKVGFGGQYLTPELRKQIVDMSITKEYLSNDIWTDLPNYAWSNINVIDGKRLHEVRSHIDMLSHSINISIIKSIYNPINNLIPDPISNPKTTKIQLRRSREKIQTQKTEEDNKRVGFRFDGKHVDYFTDSEMRTIRQITTARLLDFPKYFLSDRPAILEEYERRKHFFQDDYSGSIYAKVARDWKKCNIDKPNICVVCDEFIWETAYK